MQSSDRTLRFIQRAGEEEERKAVYTQQNMRVSLITTTAEKNSSIPPTVFFSLSQKENKRLEDNNIQIQIQHLATADICKHKLHKDSIDNPTSLITNTRKESCKTHIQKHTHTQ